MPLLVSWAIARSVLYDAAMRKADTTRTGGRIPNAGRRRAIGSIYAPPLSRAPCKMATAFIELDSAAGGVRTERRCPPRNQDRGCRLLPRLVRRASRPRSAPENTYIIHLELRREHRHGRVAPLLAADRQ